MPGRSFPIQRCHRLTLTVAVVVGVVAPAVAEVDAADKGNVALGSFRVADDDELLVVGAAKSHALDEPGPPLGPGGRLSEVTVLLGAETEHVQVRPPEQSLDDHAATGGGGEDGSYLGIRDRR